MLEVALEVAAAPSRAVGGGIFVERADVGFPSCDEFLLFGPVEEVVC